MFRPPYSSRIRTPAFWVLVLAALTVLPAAADAPMAVPLEEPRPLPEPPGMEGQSAPSVAVRPDGGIVAVWKHVGTGALLGRALGPVGAGEESDGELFTVREAGGAITGAPLVARGGDGRYLVAWVEQVPPPPSLLLHEGLFTRVFDGEGRALGERRQVAQADGFLLDLAARPGGGYAVAFRAPSQQGGGVRLLRIGPHGAPVGGAASVVEGMAGTVVEAPNLAVDRGGAIAVSWSRRSVAEETAEVSARIFTAAAEPVGEAFGLVPAEPSAGGLQHDLAAVGEGHFLLVWAGGASSPDGRPLELLGRSFDASGDLLPSHRIDSGGGPEGSSPFRSFPAVAVGPDGQAVAAWVESDTSERPVARLVLPSGLPRGAPIELDIPHEVGDPTGVRVARGADGLIAFGWGWRFMGGLVCPCPPDDVFLRWSLVRRFRADSECYALDGLDFHTEPAEPATFAPVRLVFEATGDCVQARLLGSSRVGKSIHVEAELIWPICEFPATLTSSFGVDLEALDAGPYDVRVDLVDQAVPACSERFAFSVGEGPPPPPSGVPPLTSSALPGFRVWVEIGAPPLALVDGALEPECVPETICVSGRVPGRSEVFVRIPGPKPNGLLWPTLVKLTTSEVQVWIEQVSTGTTRYYRLAGARPGFDELPGLFDRNGFVP